MKGLIIDCFAGGGGASVGIEMALGRPVDIAINHDPDAILIHKTNHPNTLHLTEDIFKVNLRKYVKDQRVALMWATSVKRYIKLLQRNTYIKCQKKRRKMMLIRRQDKKAIFNIDTCRVLYVAETVGGCFKICADQFEQLGTYKTEERAMEVLDMIATQSALCNAGVAVYLADEIEKAWYMDMPEE